MRSLYGTLLVGLVVAGCNCGPAPGVDSTKSTITVTPSMVIADGVSKATITVTVETSAGAPLAGQSVVLSVTGTDNMLTQPPVTGAAGTAVGTLTSTTVETKTITATVAGTALSNKATVQFVAGPATQLGFTLQPANVVAGANESLTVAIQDAEGHTVTGATNSITLALGGGTMGATLTPPSVMATAGLAAVTNAVVTTSGTAYTITASAAGLTSATSMPFNVTAGAESGLAFTVQPSNTVAGAPITPAVQVSVVDMYGNVVTTAIDSITVGIAMPTTVTLGGTGLSTSAIAGVATFSNLLIGQAGAAYTLGASSGTLTPATSMSFAITAGKAANLAFLVQPSAAQAGTAITPNVEVAIVDASGNTIPTAMGTITVSLTTPGNAVLSIAAGSLMQSANEGIATFTGLSVNLPGSYTLTAAGLGFTLASSMFTISAGAPAQLAFTVQPTTIVAGVPFTPPVQVSMEDSFGNVIPTATGTIQLTLVAPVGTSATLAGTSSAPATAGVAIFNAASMPPTVDTAGSGYTLTATATGYKGATSTSFNVTAGTASSSTTKLVAMPATLVADGVTTTTVTVTVDDALGNPVQGEKCTFTTNGMANTFTSSSSGNTDANGVFTATLASTMEQKETVTATCGTGASAVTATAQIVFTAGAVSGSKTTLVANPAMVTANGTSKSTLTLTVEDANGNLETTSQVVTLTLTGPNGQPITSGVNLSQTSGPTSQGVFTATITSNIAETVTVTATIASTPPVTVTTTVTFVAGAAGSSSMISANPSTLAAGLASTITVALVDSNGNPVSGQTVNVSAMANGVPAGTLAGLQSTGASSGLGVTSNGQLTFTISSTVAQTVTITADVGGLMLTTTVTFTAAGLSLSNSMLSIAPPSVTADGVSASTLTVTAEDPFTNPLTGDTVTFTASGMENSFTPPTGTCVLGTDGSCFVTISSSLEQMESITATITSPSGAVLGTLSGQISFTAGGPSTSSSSIAANPTSLLANGLATSMLTVTVKDALGNPLPGQPVTLSGSGGPTGQTFSPSATGTTNAQGVFTASVSSTIEQMDTISAVIGTTDSMADIVSTVVAFQAGAPSSSTSTLLVTPTQLTADGMSASTLTVTVLDVNGNPISGETVTITTPGATPPSSTGTTGPTGVFTSSITSKTAQVVNVTANIGGSFTLPTQTVTFVAGQPSSVNTTLVPNPASLTVGATTTLTLTVLDSNNNPVPGQAVTWMSTGSTNVLSPAMGGTTGSNGQVTFTLTSDTAEVKNVKATVGNFQAPATVTFNAGAPASVLVAGGPATTFTANPASVTADGVTTSTLTVTAEDQYGNPVPGVSVALSVPAADTTVTIGQAMGTTNATSPIGQFATTISSTTAGAVLVTAVVGNVTLNATVTFVAGGPSGSNSSFKANPTSVTADGTTTSTITITVRDAKNNPVPGATVALASSGGAKDTINFTGGVTTTNSAGVVTATISSTEEQPATIGATIIPVDTVTATIGTGSSAVTVSGQVTFTGGVASQTNSTISAAPLTVVANGTSSSTVTLTVLDANKNPVSGQMVNFAASLTNGTTLTPASGSTAANGTLQTTLTSTVSGNITVTASLGFNLTTPAIAFVAGPPSAVSTTVIGNPATLPADGTTTTTITVTIKDANGNLVLTGPTVSLSTSGGTADTLVPNGTTASTTTGTFTATLKSTKEQMDTITATIGTIAPTGTVQFTSGGASQTNSTITANPTSVHADGTSTTTLTITILDANKNPVIGQGVTLAASPSTGTNFSTTTVSTNSVGVATATLSSSTSGAIVVTATVGTGSSSFPLKVTVNFVPQFAVNGGTLGSLGTRPAPVTTKAADGGTETLQIVNDGFEYTPQACASNFCVSGGLVP